ncbi:MAG: ECF transporter S component [Clostridia bacterium]|nr:ECF transporter S component [Clostridia bacterium]
MDNKNKIRKFVNAALFASLTCVAVMIIEIPIPATNGYINAGDGIVLLGASLLGSVYGGFAAGIGASLADVFLGYARYVPATFIIKFIMAFIAGMIFKKSDPKKSAGIILCAFASGLASETVMIAGYFVYEALLLGYGFAGALAGVPGNIFQGIGGTVIYAILLFAVRKNKFLSEKMNLK